jgi:predicted PurR-regulated permease PerM
MSQVQSQVAPKVSSFGNLLGQTFEVQALTSLVNAVLTSLVIWALKIPGLGFFALLTFFSSFVPLLGIAISTTPPLIVALVERGFATCLQLVLLIAAVHTVEAYLLYPQIYAVKLKMHPVLVTGALVVAEHYFGIPGLVLAVPVTLFFSKQLFAKPEDASSAL